MRLLIHDLEEEIIQELLPDTMNSMTIISDDGTFNHCLGCFGCWIKTPGACIIRDQYGDMGEYLSKCHEVIIISKCFYGGFSPFVKKIIDRSISYVHPYFEIRNKEMHHRSRYENRFDLKVWFYSKDITEREKYTAEKLIHRNGVNLNCSSTRVTFVRDIIEIKGHIK